METAKTKITIGEKVYDLKNKDEMEQFVNYLFNRILLMPKTFPPTRKLILIFASCTSLIIIFGILISIYFSDWIWFSRFGSLCVVVGILFIFYDISDYYDKKIRAISRTRLFIKNIFEQQIKKTLQKSNLTNEQFAEIQIIYQKAIKDLDEWPENIEVQHEKQVQKSKLRIWEACILLIGTIIWGFGDLIGVLLNL